ncbi:MAG: D-aminoacylase [Bryobacteraceae bacterium]
MRLPLALLLAVPLYGADYDLILRGARVVDGAGNPWFRADVGVKDGKIARIGDLSRASGTKTIDAKDRVLAPGFIDVHTHLDGIIPEGTIEHSPMVANYLTDGVTTMVTGNCGSSNADLGAFFKRLEKLTIGPNLASLIGHNTVRREVMGTANRQATADEIAKMRALVAKNMQAGAVGFSTGLIYIPGTYARTEEVVALAEEAARFGGVYASHIRDEGAQHADAIEEAVHVGRANRMRVQISHFKVSNRRLWGSSEKSLALIDKARREGVDVVMDQYPYDHSSTHLGTTLPSWALADGDDRVRERLRDPATRAKIAQEMETIIGELGHPDYSYATVASCDFDRSLEGKNISQINRLKGRQPTIPEEIQTILDLQAQGRVTMVFHSMGEKDVERIMRHPHVAIASDGWAVEFGKGVPHPRSYGTNARVFAEFVRERGNLTLEDAVRKMTSLPARTFGFDDRGLVRPGYRADLVLFDPARVQDKATFEKPHQYSEGFDVVLVNGVAVIENGKLTSARPGQIVRRTP